MSSEGIKAFFKNEVRTKLFVPLLAGLSILLALSLFGASAPSEDIPEDEAERLSSICSLVDGVGECKIMLTYSDEKDGSRVTSAAVIYNGGGGVETERELKELISSLYGIGTNRIAVISSKKQ